jgi:hypothetical protein
MKQQRARESGQLLLSRKLAEESEIWRINMLERMEQLSASIGDSQADRRTDGGEQ